MFVALVPTSPYPRTPAGIRASDSGSYRRVGIRANRRLWKTRSAQCAVRM